MVAYILLYLMTQSASAFAHYPPVGFDYWNLPTGSRIAYVRYPAAPPAKLSPVVFLHGGPGAYLVNHLPVVDQFYRSIATLGLDVYIYDQVGSGHSERLTDPRQYTVDRHVRDLEAIRQRIGADRLILVGDSWGATLGANYIAAHPDRCAKAIFSSPGALDSTGIPGGSYYEDAPMAKSAEEWFAGLYSQPRYRKLGDILAADVPSEYRLHPDVEMDSQLDAFVQRSLPFLVCDPTRLPAGESVHGMGWWANLMTGVDFARRKQISRKITKIPILILRGGCDYMRWEVVLQYRVRFPESILLYVPDAGHAFGYDQPQLYASAVRAFLLNQSLPVRPYEGTAAPPRVTPRAVLK